MSRPGTSSVGSRSSAPDASFIFYFPDGKFRPKSDDADGGFWPPPAPIGVTTLFVSAVPPGRQLRRISGPARPCVLEARSSTPDESCVTRGATPANQILGLVRFLAQNLVFLPSSARSQRAQHAPSTGMPAPASRAENCEKSRVRPRLSSAFRALSPWRVWRSRRPGPACAWPNRRGAARRTCRRPPARRAPHRPPWHGHR